MCNELAEPIFASLRPDNAGFFPRNNTALASCWQHCVQIDWVEIWISDLLLQSVQSVRSEIRISDLPLHCVQIDWVEIWISDLRVTARPTRRWMFSKKQIILQDNTKTVVIITCKEKKKICKKSLQRYSCYIMTVDFLFLPKTALYFMYLLLKPISAKLPIRPLLAEHSSTVKDCAPMTLSHCLFSANHGSAFSCK